MVDLFGVRWRCVKNSIDADVRQKFQFSAYGKSCPLCKQRLAGTAGMARRSSSGELVLGAPSPDLRDPQSSTFVVSFRMKLLKSQILSLGNKMRL